MSLARSAISGGRHELVVAGLLRGHDQVLPLRTLLAGGLTREQVAALRHRDVLLRPRIGWYCDPALPDAAVRALRVGGVLGCVSAAQTFDIVTPERHDSVLHVSLPTNASRLRASTGAPARRRACPEPGVHRHWEERLSPARGFRVDVPDVLLQMSHCVPDYWFIAAMDSALRPRGRTKTPLLDDRGLDLLRSASSERTRSLIARADGRSEGVGETFGRLGFQDAGVDVEPNVWLTDEYRGDLLLEGRLLFEVDGKQHGTPDTMAYDRERDAALAWFGMRTLRFTTRQVLDRWPWVLDVTQRVLASTPRARRR